MAKQEAKKTATVADYLRMLIQQKILVPIKVGVGQRYYTVSFGGRYSF